jgi:hypothetical protein
MSREALKGILQEDDAARYLASLPEDQRRPQYVTNKLPPSPESFTKEEREAAMAVFSPHAPIGTGPE